MRFVHFKLEGVEPEDVLEKSSGVSLSGIITASKGHLPLYHTSEQFETGMKQGEFRHIFIAYSSEFLDEIRNE